MFELHFIRGPKQVPSQNKGLTDTAHPGVSPVVAAGADASPVFAASRFARSCLGWPERKPVVWKGIGGVLLACDFLDHPDL